MASKIYTIQKSAISSTHFIELDAADIERLTKDGNKRVLVSMQGGFQLHASIQKSQDGMYFLMIGSRHLKTLKIKPPASIKATIAIDNSEYQFDMPDELTEVLATDEDAKLIFAALTDGNKRGLMALVNMVKSSDKKIERSLLIAEKLKQGITAPQKIMKK